MLVQGDSARIPLPDKSVHTVCTSPPYWGLRKYSGEQGRGMFPDLGLEKTPQEHIERIVQIMAEVHRVLRDDGVVWLNYGDCYNSNASNQQYTTGAHGGSDGGLGRYNKAIKGLAQGQLMLMPHRIAIALQDWGWIVRNDVVWFKRNPMPESQTGWFFKAETGELKKGSFRHTRAHEFVFMLTKKMQYWSNQEAVRVPHSAGSIERGYPKGGHGKHIKNSDVMAASTEFNRMLVEKGKRPTPGGVNPRSVMKAPEIRHYELPDGTICIVSEDCPVHGHRQDAQTQQMEFDGEQASLFLNHNEHTDDHDPEFSSEQLSNSDHSNQKLHQPKMDFQNHENEPEHNLESIDENKKEGAHSGAYDEDAQILSDNENIEASTIYPFEAEHSDLDDRVAKDHSISDYKKNALSTSPNMVVASEDPLHIDHNESVCSCKWIIPQTQYAASVLDVPTAPYSGAHYATFPPNLIAPLIRATCPRWACPVCGQGWSPVVEKSGGTLGKSWHNHQNDIERGQRVDEEQVAKIGDGTYEVSVKEYRPTCSHEHTKDEAVPGIVLDPFVGSGTTPMVAKQLLRRGIGLDISLEYLDEQAKVRTGSGTPSKALDDLPLFNQ